MPEDRVICWMGRELGISCGSTAIVGLLMWWTVYDNITELAESYFTALIFRPQFPTAHDDTPMTEL